MKKKNLIKHIKIWGVIFLLSLAAILIGSEIYLNYKDFNKSVVKLRENYVNQQKHTIKQEVDQVVSLIEYKIKLADKSKEEIEQELLEIIRGIRFGDEGYIFVNRLNGDALVFNGNVLSETKKLWDIGNNNQEKVKALFQLEYEAALKPKGDYINYSFIKLSNSKSESPKVSFIQGVPELQWLVGAGVYLDDIEEDILLMKEQLTKSLEEKLIYSIFVVVVVISLFLFLLNAFSNKLKNDFKQFNLFFERAAEENIPVNIPKIEFAQLEEMAKNANRMLEDKNKAQQDLRYEREQLFVTIHSIGDALITTDAVGKIDLMNNVAEELTGWRIDEAKGRELKEVFNIINEKSREEVQNPVFKVLSENKIVGLANHTILISKDGTEYNISDSAAPIRNAENNVQGVVLVFRDISGEYKILEELRKSEERYKIITDATGDIYYVLNFNGMSYEYIHPNVEKMTGYKTEEFDLKQMIVKIEKYGDDIDLNKIEGKNENFKNRLYSADYLIKTKSGEEKWIADASFPFFDKDGNETGSYGVLTDISERKEMENKLLRAKNRAENADKMKSTFLAQMSHEIRTPINALVSMASLLRYDFEEIANEDQLMSFDVIDRAGERIIRTIDLLLNLSEIQAGTYEVNFTKFDIFAEVLSRIIAENKMLAKKKNIELNLIYSVQNSEIVADHYTVNQIFTQLIDNAIKYTKEGKVIVEILRNEMEQLVVEVKDTGIGIEENYLPKIFDAFSQEEMGYTRKYEGNGIGLTLVKTYCKLNKAKIEVESTKSIGSVFRVIFSA